MVGDVAELLVEGLNILNDNVKDSKMEKTVNMLADVDLNYLQIFFRNNTLKVLDALSARGIKATFMVIGSRVYENPQILKQVVDAGKFYDQPIYK